MSWTNSSAAMLVSLLISSALLTGCHGTLPTLPPAAELPRIPSPPVKPEPVPSGTYFRLVCSDEQSLRARLKLTTPMPSFCTDGGSASTNKD